MVNLYNIPIFFSLIVTVGIRASYPEMAEGTRVSQLCESMNQLKETQESQQRILDEVVQQLQFLATSYDSLSRSRQRDMGDNSHGKSINCQADHSQTDVVSGI